MSEQRDIKLQNFTPTTLKMLRPQIEAGLKELGDRLGIDFKAGNASYDIATAHFKLEMTLVGDVEGKSPEQIRDIKLRAEFEKYSVLFGLTSEDFGREITLQGDTFAIIGVNPKAPKNGYLGRSSNGTVYKLRSLDVESELKKAA